MQLWLASTSPRREALLKTLGVPFKVIAPRFVEQSTGRPPEEEARYFAEQKARSVANLCHGGCVIGGDTLIDLDGAKIGQPRDLDEARTMLARLSGRTHTVVTAVVLLDTVSGGLRSAAGKSAVTFRVLAADEIDRYVKSGEPMGKAGGYAIQENGRTFIARIDGDEDVVIGLPLAPILHWLGVARPRSALPKTS